MGIFLNRKNSISFVANFLWLIIGFFTSDISLAAGKVQSAQFLVVHKQSNQENLQLMREFSQRVKEKTKGELEITVTPFISKLPEELKSLKHSGPFVAIPEVYGGQVQMSQVPIDRLLKLNQEIDVLDMPMIFKNHDHAERVLDGPIGDELRESLLISSNHRVRGLAFTYSGGWRNIYSVKAIKSLGALKGQKMIYRGGRMGNDFMYLLGIQPIVGFLSLESFVAGHFEGHLEAEEAETNRIADFIDESPSLIKAIKTVLETRHSLFLTVIIVNEDFFNSLSPSAQEVLEAEARVLAKKERALSIRQESENRKLLMNKGIKFVEMSKADQSRLNEWGMKVQEKYRQYLGKYVDQIRSAGEPLKTL